MKTVIRLGVAQIACTADKDQNLALHRAAIAEAGARGVDLLVFPELSLTDYRTVPDMAAACMATDLVELAGDVAVLAGFIEAGQPGLFHNAAALLRGGAVVGSHRKLNLPTYGGLEEGKHFAPGRRLDLVEALPGWPAATLICADAWNPALPWLAALKGAALMLLPIASARGAVGDGFDNPGGWEVTLRHIAMTYGMPLAMANHCGRRGTLDFWGGSRILDADGRCLALAGEGPEIIAADIALKDIGAARHRLPTMRDAAPLTVQALLAETLRNLR
ncbi:MAG: nitrilase-related carbon-nitrogen hydrolase [Ferrovibrionaceae bacterium]